MVGGLITVWVNLNIKVKEIDVKILALEEKLENFKVERTQILEHWEKTMDKVDKKLDRIETKIDSKFEELAYIKGKNKL